MPDFGPYLEFVRIQTEMNKLFESLQELREPPETPESGAAWVPNVDICECGDLLIVEAELPGVEPETLCVQVGGGNLILQGAKDRMVVQDPVVFHRRDRAYGTFKRIIPLTAAVNTHKAKAVLDAGVLRIEFPKVPNKRGEAITIPVERVEV
ncbi:MAG: Hsp20/alpha crystallin family protein [Acidobacteriota bacterium]